jgi:hypothetical protein
LKNPQPAQEEYMRIPKRESIEWCDIWITHGGRASLPRVLLIGDSIARSYYPCVENALKNRFACARLATSKCLCDPGFHKDLKILLDDYEFAGIHFNNGLHGWGYSDDSYKACFPRLLQLFKARAPRSKLIWASSTPVRAAGNLGRFSPYDKRVRQRNCSALEIARARNIPVNDLYETSVNRPDYFADDGVHFNATGQAALADQVVRAILRETGMPKPVAELPQPNSRGVIHSHAEQSRPSQAGGKPHTSDKGRVRLHPRREKSGNGSSLTTVSRKGPK